MAITNYAELKTAVADWGNRTDLTALIPDFVRMAHDVIVGEIVMSADLTVSSETVAQPADFRRISSLWLDRGPKQPLTLSDELAMQGYGSGVPAVYRIDGTDIIVAPSPDQTYPGKALYKIATTQLSADADANVVLTKYPFVYLWGALAELGAYLHDAELAAGYGGKFRDEIDRINRVERDNAMDGPLQTTPGTSYGVTP